LMEVIGASPVAEDDALLAAFDAYHAARDVPAIVDSIEIFLDAALKRPARGFGTPIVFSPSGTNLAALAAAHNSFDAPPPRSPSCTDLRRSSPLDSPRVGMTAATAASSLRVSPPGTPSSFASSTSAALAAAAGGGGAVSLVTTGLRHTVIAGDHTAAAPTALAAAPVGAAGVLPAAATAAAAAPLPPALAAPTTLPPASAAGVSGESTGTSSTSAGSARYPAGFASASGGGGGGGAHTRVTGPFARAAALGDLFSPAPGGLLSVPSTIVYYCREMAPVARELATGRARDAIVLHEIDWKCFPDGWPNLFAHDVKDCRFNPVLFLASFHSMAALFEQLSVIYALPAYAKRFTVVVPFYPTGE